MSVVGFSGVGGVCLVVWLFLFFLSMTILHGCKTVPGELSKSKHSETQSSAFFRDVSRQCQSEIESSRKLIGQQTSHLQFRSYFFPNDVTYLSHSL